MNERNISASQRDWLVGELAQWESAGVVSGDQRARILDFYPSEQALATRRHGWALLTLMGIAALMVGLAALLAVAYNWQAMPRELKLATIFGALVLTHAAGFELRFRYRKPLASQIAFFLGCLLFGAGIFLLAQIFNRSGHPPDAVWWWAVGVLPVAVALDTILLHALLTALLAIWCGMELTGFYSIGTPGFWFWRLISHGAWSLPLLVLPGIVQGYRRGSVATVSLYVPLVALWIILQPISWRFSMQSVYLIGSLGALLLVVAECHPLRSPFAIPYRWCGALLVGGALLAMSFHEFNRDMLRWPHGDRYSPLPIIAAGVCAALAFVIALLGPVASGERSAGARLRRAISREWLPLGIALVMVLVAAWQPLMEEPIFPTVVSNLAMLAVAAWLITLGLEEDRGRPFAAGVGYFLLWTSVRYIDLFGNYGGMLGAAALFLLCGMTLFGVAYFWRNRKQVLHARNANTG